VSTSRMNRWILFILIRRLILNAIIYKCSLRD
jgi:hypothetical protein